MSVARLQVPAQAKRGDIVEIRVAIQHPMETGYRHDAMGNTIPKNTINNLVCRYNSVDVFRAEMGSGITANPYLEFSVIATGSGNIEFAWVDDAGEKGSVSAPLVVIA